jgi:hypothetical protein
MSHHYINMNPHRHRRRRRRRSGKCSKVTFQPESYMQRTTMCTNFLQSGSCPYGNRCEFAHGDGWPLFDGTATVDHVQPCSRTTNARYKTLPCRHWHEFGQCPYAMKCVFTHNESPERLTHLRRFCPPVHNKWPVQYTLLPTQPYRLPIFQQIAP